MAAIYMMTGQLQCRTFTTYYFVRRTFYVVLFNYQ